MFTESRFVQWPHLTVTSVNMLLHGTLTCQTKHVQKHFPISLITSNFHNNGKGRG